MLFALTSFALVRAETAPILTPAEALLKEGQSVTVEFRVKGGGYTPVGFAELYSESRWNHPQCFTLRFSEGVQERLRRVGIFNPPEHFKNETMRVTGTVKTFTSPNYAGKWGCIEADDLEHFEAIVPPFVATSKYVKKDVQGFSILLSPEIVSHDYEMNATLKELDVQLGNIKRVLSPEQFAILVKVRIWVEWENLRHPSAAYYRGASLWSRIMGLNPEKAKCIEIGHVRHFLEWSQSAQPWMLMHELSHFYHEEVLGKNFAGIANAYRNAMDSGRYQQVPYTNGTIARAYAAKDDGEYFAELTEAWFGRNDYYPFTRSELLDYDPTGYKLMEDVWSGKLGMTK